MKFLIQNNSTDDDEVVVMLTTKKLKSSNNIFDEKVDISFNGLNISSNFYVIAVVLSAMFIMLIVNLIFNKKKFHKLKKRIERNIDFSTISSSRPSTPSENLIIFNENSTTKNNLFELLEPSVNNPLTIDNNNYCSPLEEKTSINDES